MKTSNSITSLPVSPEQDRGRRFHRYVWQMSVRVILFVIAVLMYTWWHTWFCVIPILLAAVIPWVAVVIANAGNKQGAEPDRPAGQIVLLDTDAKAAREAEEDRREAAYRDDQNRRRQQAEQEQEAWAHATPGFRRPPKDRR